mmetsp:Transcript_53519/g.122513  ORF Transcript_53519/g.122513 Transcript_53519/m.122513 type:complete len:361 (-) Transcript_53519:838-1920(-)
MVPRDTLPGPGVIEGKILHELGWELDGIPLHVVRSSCHPLFLRCHHGLQSMAPLVEQRHHLPGKHQHRPRPHPPLVHHDPTQRNRPQQRRPHPHRLVPRPGLLLPRPGEQVKIGVGDGSGVAPQAVKSDGGVPDLGTVGRGLVYGNAVEPLCELKHPLHDVIQLQVLGDLQEINRMLLLIPLPRVVGHIVGLQFPHKPQRGGKFLELLQFHSRLVPRGGLDLPQELGDLGPSGHLRRQGEGGVVLKPKEPRDLLPLPQHLKCHLPVVVLPAGRLGHHRRQDPLPHLPVGGEAQHAAHVNPKSKLPGTFLGRGVAPRLFSVVPGRRPPLRHQRQPRHLRLLEKHHPPLSHVLHQIRQELGA